jgi:hypothetical protein
MRLAVAATLGRLSLLAVAVNETHAPGGARASYRTVTGVGRTRLPYTTVVINDATADAGALADLFLDDRPFHVITPRGRLGRLHPVVQIVPAADVTRGRRPGPVADLLRGVLHGVPARYPRVGLLTHQNLLPPVLAGLGDCRGRLTLASHFGGGLSRGSNAWPAKCDALVTLGTPRVPPAAIRQHLLRLGKVAAAGLTEAEAGWHQVYWTGRTLSGAERLVRTGRYRDPDWDAAYRALVCGELWQAVGRGRGILPEGMPVYVVTTESLGDIPLADAGTFAPLTPGQGRALGCLRGSSAGQLGGAARADRRGGRPPGPAPSGPQPRTEGAPARADADEPDPHPPAGVRPGPAPGQGGRLVPALSGTTSRAAY